jgi:hypothetical protein
MHSLAAAATTALSHEPDIAGSKSDSAGGQSDKRSSCCKFAPAARYSSVARIHPRMRATLEVSNEWLFQ